MKEKFPIKDKKVITWKSAENKAFPAHVLVLKCGRTNVKMKPYDILLKKARKLHLEVVQGSDLGPSCVLTCYSSQVVFLVVSRVETSFATLMA